MAAAEHTSPRKHRSSLLAAGIRWPEALAACGAAVIFPALLGGVTGSFGPLSQSIRASMALTSVEMGLLGGAYLLALACGQLVAGPLIDRFGVRKLSMVALVGLGAIACAFALADSLASAVALRLLMGAAAAFAVPGYGAVAARMTSSGGFAVAMGAASFAFGMASVVGTWVGAGAAASGAEGWRTIYWFIAAATVPGIISVGAALRGPRFVPIANAAGTSRAAAMISLVRNGDVRRALLIGLGLGGVLFSFGRLWNSYVVRVIWQLPVEDWGLVTSMFHLAYSIASTIIPLLALRFGPLRVLRVATGCAFVFLALWLLSPVQLTSTTAALVAGALGASLSAIAINTALAVRSVPLSQAGTCVALVGSTGLFSGFAMQFLPTLTTQIDGTTPLLRGIMCGSVMALVVGIGHVATYRSRAAATTNSPATPPGS